MWSVRNKLEYLKYWNVTLLHFSTFKQSSRRRKTKNQKTVCYQTWKHGKFKIMVKKKKIYNFKSAKYHLLHLTLLSLTNPWSRGCLIQGWCTNKTEQNLQRTRVFIKRKHLSKHDCAPLTLHTHRKVFAVCKSTIVAWSSRVTLSPASTAK